MQHFAAIFAQGGDLHPALLQEVDAVGAVAKHEDPFATLTFCYSHPRIELICCGLTHSAKQPGSGYGQMFGITMGDFYWLVHGGSCLRSGLYWENFLAQKRKET
jgi:hypothetical protein